VSENLNPAKTQIIRTFVKSTGIGDLIIDLDADIEKSSSSNLDSSLVIPLQSTANLSSSQRNAFVDKKNQSNDQSDSSSESNKSSLQTQLEGKYDLMVINFHKLIVEIF